MANDLTVDANVSIKITLKKLFTFLKIPHQKFNLKKKKKTTSNKNNIKISNLIIKKKKVS